MATNVIELRDVSKTIHGQEILRDLDLKVHHGEFLTLLGPSGCGKTTLLRLISGFEEPTTGTVYINDKNASGLPPHLRHVHTVFQSYALFPHMTAWENVAFGLRCHKRPKEEIKERVTDALKTVKLEKFAARKPQQLSGGQQQRVAIARAMVNQPLVLLLDEPLSSLDYHLRKTMQIELKQLQRKLGITFIFVTHDQEEALSLSDRVVVMREGSIEQVGTPQQVYEEPANLSVACFIGKVNIFDATVTDNNEKNTTVDIQGRQYVVKSKIALTLHQKIHILVRPEDLIIRDQNEVTSPMHLFSGSVEEVIYKGTTVDLIIRLPDKQLITATRFFNEDDDKLEYVIGDAVWVTWLSGWEMVLPYET